MGPVQEVEMEFHAICVVIWLGQQGAPGGAPTAAFPLANFYVTNRLDERFQGASVSNSTYIVNSYRGRYNDVGYQDFFFPEFIRGNKIKSP